jgi:predicted O-linked N-acetylglucosamine transferase (SPINDLY family)
LASNRDSRPLFDTASYTRHIEAAYSLMWQRYLRGEPPASYAVDA